MDYMAAGDMGHPDNNYMTDLDNVDEDDVTDILVGILVIGYFIATGLAIAINLFSYGLHWIWSCNRSWTGFGAE